jgi:hypothetical protein
LIADFLIRRRARASDFLETVNFEIAARHQIWEFYLRVGKRPDFSLFLRPEREYKIIGLRENETGSPIPPPLLL